MRAARPSGPVVVPHDSLSPDALQGVLEEFVTREGTDYGGGAVPGLADKVRQVREQVRSGAALILFDSDSGRTHIVPAEERKR